MSFMSPNKVVIGYLFQGMGGTLAAVANLLAIMVSKTPLDQGFGYFLTALIVIVLAFIGYLALPHFVSNFTPLNILQ